MTRAVEIWIDADIAPLARVGTLHDDRGQVRFHYDDAWLRDARAFAIDPDLSLGEKPFFPRPEAGSFGVFLDSAPDRWGQTLMHRRETLAARDAGRPPRTLYAWDFLLGVQDLTRQGALRVCAPGTGEFLANERLAAPPVTSLAELADIARELTARRIDDLEQLRRWLAVLVAPGASLGGARPKANFTQSDGTLWIGKFPAMHDNRDAGAWEYVAYRLGQRASLDLPSAQLVRFGDFHTFCVQRFDRVQRHRRFYASAMTLLRCERSEGKSYLDLAQFLQNHGDPQWLDADLEQLFRRAVFNVMIGNRDDHLRNHGFILGTNGWRLAPAFDLNPDVGKDHHVLNLDDRDPYPSVATLLQTHEFYRLDREQAGHLVEGIAIAVDGWRDAARQIGIGRADVELTATAFSAHTSYREGTDRPVSPPPGRSSRRNRS